MIAVRVGDCLDILPTLDAESVDAIVTDPPYHLTTGKKGGSGDAGVNLDSPYGRSRIGTGFMGKKWDGGDVAFRAETWAAALRVAKPGAHLVAFGGTRTFHRLTCAIEDAGWEIRDCLSWLYGSGFPKSHNGPWGGTALKPAWEPVILARKPLSGTVAANHAEHGTGALNIDGCRIEGAKRNPGFVNGRPGSPTFGQISKGDDGICDTLGRWPANVVLDEAAAALLDAQSGEREGPGGPATKGSATAWPGGAVQGRIYPKETGGASRFFYTAKASRSERNAGVEHLPEKKPHGPSGDGRTWDIPGSKSTARANHHPTVKPLDLMQWLCRLVTPKGGLILDPFCGSGSTGRAAIAEGFSFLGIELSEEYAEIARARIAEYAPLFNDGAA
jgi:site-specific DNA-methyltransferase (adenine-specific)